MIQKVQQCVGSQTFNKQWYIWTQRDGFILHLSSYCNIVFLWANQWIAYTIINTCRKLSSSKKTEEKCDFKL